MRLLLASLTAVAISLTLVGPAHPRVAQARVARADALADTLERLERQSWDAWKARDSAFFRAFLSDDHVEMGVAGPSTKTQVVGMVGSPLCHVNSFSVSDFHFTRFNETTALLTYHAAQDTKCGANAVPSPVWVSSLFVKRGARWLNAAYQQTPDTRK